MGKKIILQLLLAKILDFVLLLKKKYINNNHDDVIYTACSLLS